MHLERFYIAHLENDTAEMNRQLEWPKVRPDEEDGFLGYQGAIEARRGRMKIARELERRGMEASERDSATEEAAGFPAVLAVWDADYGESELCRHSVTVALALAQTREVRLRVALALARVGDSSRAQALAEKLHGEYPSDTLINLYWLPLIRAAIELNRRNPDGAIKQLQPASPYDLAADGFEDMYIVYLRGEAFRLAHRGIEAAAEFQKVLDNRGPLAVSTIDALARLGLGRAFALQGDTATARAKYQDFLTLWKDADPDIPILKQAKAEYAKLK
jgi:eukaryotic-like serine/threonine-protein kinase